VTAFSEAVMHAGIAAILRRCGVTTEMVMLSDLEELGSSARKLAEDSDLDCSRRVLGGISEWMDKHMG
jgi:hypothetical protein